MIMQLCCTICYKRRQQPVALPILFSFIRFSFAAKTKKLPSHFVTGQKRCSAVPPELRAYALLFYGIQSYPRDSITGRSRRRILCRCAAFPHRPHKSIRRDSANGHLTINRSLYGLSCGYFSRSSVYDRIIPRAVKYVKRFCK